MTEQQQRKQHIRAFFQHYTDERLAMLLAHALDGKLAYASCCCFIGIPTADHALCGARGDWNQPHYLLAREKYDTSAALAYGDLSQKYDGDDDEIRRRIIIPMIRAEWKRRALSRPSEITPADVAAMEVA